MPKPLIIVYKLKRTLPFLSKKMFFWDVGRSETEEHSWHSNPFPLDESKKQLLVLFEPASENIPNSVIKHYRKNGYTIAILPLETIFNDYDIDPLLAASAFVEQLSDLYCHMKICCALPSEEFHTTT